MPTSLFSSGSRSASGLQPLFGVDACISLDEPIGAVDIEPAVIDVEPSSPDDSVEWNEADIVELHWRLLLDLRHLADPDAPLDEKLDALRWVFAEPEKAHCPFSFRYCIRIVGCSPLARNAYFGRLDSDSIRAWIRNHVGDWLIQTLARYPTWIRRAIVDHPDWVEDRLADNPQWINEQMRRAAGQGDLFIAS